MEFEGDWPGVFIRGDNAAYFAMCLDSLINRPGTDPLSEMQVHGLLDLLRGSDARTNPVTQKARLILEAECTPEETSI